jgi:chemotaxis-related protein WspD
MIDDCWNRIGVHGDASCPELETYVHCRNCPVYSTAAKVLLDVELPPGYLAQWTSYIAQERLATAPDTQSVVIFRVGIDWLALPTALFVEIADERAIHSIPQRRGGTVLGVANVRGRLIVCVSLERILGLGNDRERDSHATHAAAERLLVLAWAADRIVCPVSEVHGIHRFHSRDLTEPPGTIAKATASYTKAVRCWQNKSVALLDERWLNDTFERSLASTAI